MTLDHSDRDAIREIAGNNMPALVTEHGGRRRGHSYFCPFHDNTRTPAASIKFGRFRCFGCGLSLGPIEFVMRAQHIDFKSAMEFLSARFCIPLNNRKLSPAERSQYLRNRAAADREARELVEWRDKIVAMLRGARDTHLHAYHRAKNFIVAHSMQHPKAVAVADIADHSELRYLELDDMIALVMNAPWRTLRDFYRHSRQTRGIAA